jgi:putative copper export protein
LGAVSSLWLGDGHLLQVSATLGVENYRRWYLREIQAVIVRRTRTRAIWNLIWGILGCLAFAAAAGFAGLAAASAKNEGQIPLYVFAGIAGSCAALFAALILWNSLLGPTCTVFVQTPAGLQPLAAPARLRAADGLLSVLAPLIEEAQLQRQSPDSA